MIWSKQMDLISIIIPVYNVEQYLDRCVESVVNQTYQNLEIILVDDGSPDNCPAMCDEWAKKDARIKVVHKENGGLSDARNAGMDVALGDYIGFVDSDDWIHGDYIKILYNSLIRYNADISACSVNKVYAGVLEEKVFNDYKSTVFNNKEAMESLIFGKEFASNVWNKLYSASLLKNELFVKGKLHEDEYFSYKIFAKINTAVYNNVVLYYYFQRDNSIMNSFSIKHFDMADAYIERIEFLSKNYPDLVITDKISYLQFLVNSCINAIKFNNIEAVKICKKYVKKLKLTRNELKMLNTKNKLYYFGAKINIKLFAKLLNLIHR